MACFGGLYAKSGVNVDTYEKWGNGHPCSLPVPHYCVSRVNARYATSETYKSVTVNKQCGSRKSKYLVVLKRTYLQVTRNGACAVNFLALNMD